MIVDKNVDQKRNISAPNRNREEKKEESGHRKSFSLFGKKSNIESLRKMSGTLASPIMADAKAVEELSGTVIERYASR